MREISNVNFELMSYVKRKKIQQFKYSMIKKVIGYNLKTID